MIFTLLSILPQIFDISLNLDYFLYIYQMSITIGMQKLQKNIYLIAKSFLPIVLLNIICQIAKSVLVKRISVTTKIIEFPQKFILRTSTIRHLKIWFIIWWKNHTKSSHKANQFFGLCCILQVPWIIIPKNAFFILLKNHILISRL